MTVGKWLAMTSRWMFGMAVGKWIASVVSLLRNDEGGSGLITKKSKEFIKVLIR